MYRERGFVCEVPISDVASQRADGVGDPGDEDPARNQSGYNLIKGFQNLRFPQMLRHIRRRDGGMGRRAGERQRDQPALTTAKIYDRSSSGRWESRTYITTVDEGGGFAGRTARMRRGVRLIEALADRRDPFR